MPDIFPPVPTPQQVVQARNDRLQSFGLASGTVAGITALNYRFNAPFGKVVQKGIQLVLTGVEAKPTPTGRAAIRLPAASLGAYFLPSPVGFVPGEFYGLHPDVVFRTLGIHAGKKPIVFAASEERKMVFEARMAAERIGAKALGKGVTLGRANGLPFGDIPPGKIDVTPEELEFLKSLPPDFTPSQSLVPQLEARRTDLARSPVPQQTGFHFFSGGLGAPGTYTIERVDTGVSRAAVLPASVQAAAVRAVNAKAIAAAARAVGVRKQLVAERADP